MKIKLPKKFHIIAETSPRTFQKLGKVQRAQAQNYKAGITLPPLEKAYIFEKELNIPMSLWIELKQYKESQDNV